MNRFVFCLSLLAFISCGKNEEGAFQEPFLNNFNMSEDGIYKGFFLPINSSVVGLTSGNVKLKLMNDLLEMKIVMIDTPQAEHLQYIYEGDRCPNTEDDLNQDGYIDAKEGEEVYGKALIPLDSEISQQIDVETEFPIPNRLGSYTYEQTSQWSKILQDLSMSDSNPKDHIIKTDDGVNLGQKVIVIHGVDSSIYLPSTVEGLESIDVRKSLPIACAKIDFTNTIE